MMTSEISVPIKHALNDAVPLEDLTIDRLLQHHFPEIPFLRRFRENPLLQRVTLGQVMSKSYALNDFLAKCRVLPGCGESAINRLRWVIEAASKSRVAGAPEAAVQRCTSCGASRAHDALQPGAQSAGHAGSRRGA